MKNDLTCAVVRDLLPSFAEGLTGAETNAAVEAHLSVCPDCAASLAAMRQTETAPAGAEREVDYLKALRRRGRRKVALGILCTAALLLCALGAKLFLIGEAAGKSGLSWSVLSDGKTDLQLRVFTAESAASYCRWRVEETDGVVTITARKVLSSPLYPSGDYRTTLDLSGVREVYLGGKLLWQNGVTIFPSTAALYDAKTPYVGNASALGRITAALVPGLPGGYTMALQTAEEPYEWTFVYDIPCTARAAVDLDRRMQEAAPLLFALVGNLGEISWTYPLEGGDDQSRTVTLSEVNDTLGEKTAAYNAANGADLAPRDSVRDYLDSAADLQRLVNLLQP
ncbi:DUF4825 domain-containing protein [Oscillibacter sp.]|uniref:DUF4825 domain-containing protein n=1 Tax=Oscillibacter sp. TaxID=1945593 RepID=UPI002602356B|nr:DUF4825 domain-containing protein [Oscillibacter sp.]MDD3346108.1 DUF4825 domain-containing protein [Oscillibacter sp.]